MHSIYELALSQAVRHYRSGMIRTTGKRRAQLFKVGE